jgi:hypothetical protein
LQQKTAKISKRAAWSVYIFIERQAQEGRSVRRRKRLTAQIPDRYIAGPATSVIHKFLYLNVTKMYKKVGILYIQVGMGKKKEIHKHEVKDVASIQVREYKRDGRIE